MSRLRGILWRYRELLALWALAAALILVQVAGPKAWPGGGMPLLPTGRPPPTSQVGIPTWPTTTTRARGSAPTTTSSLPTATIRAVGPNPPPPTTTLLSATTVPLPSPLPSVTLPTTLTAVPTTTGCLRPGPQPGPPVTWRGPPLTATTVGQKHDRCRPAG